MPTYKSTCVLMQQWVATFRGGRQGVSDVLRHGIVGKTLAQIQWLICHSQFDVLIPLRERKKTSDTCLFAKMNWMIFVLLTKHSAPGLDICVAVGIFQPPHFCHCYWPLFDVVQTRQTMTVVLYEIWHNFSTTIDYGKNFAESPLKTSANTSQTVTI